MPRQLLTNMLCIMLCLPVSSQAAQQKPAASRPANTRQPALAALSITPAQSEPGGRVVMTMNGPVGGARLYIGGKRIPTEQLDEHHLAFSVPTLPAGLYALGLLTPDGISRSYNFTILAIRPVTIRIEPDQITGCALNGSTEAIVYGRHFTESTQLLFDGAIIASQYQSPETIKFRIPRVSGGLHQVTVRTQNESTTPLAFNILTQPEINSVSIGTDRVTSYDLIINGSNFQQGSQLLVDGVRVESSSRGPGGQLTSIDCNLMIYQRSPITSTPVPLKLQVVNPGGETSQPYLVTAP